MNIGIVFSRRGIIIRRKKECIRGTVFLGEQDILLAIPCCNSGGKTSAEDRLHAMQHLRQRLKGKQGEIARNKGSV